MLVTELVFQSPMFWLKTAAPFEHLIHVGGVAYVPACYVFVEGRPVEKSVLHVRHRGSIPVADVPVGGCCIGFVAEPKIDRGFGSWRW